jgi:hypothetical protein
MGKAVLNTGAAVPVDFAQIGVVAEPQHKLGLIFMNVGKDLVVASVGIAGRSYLVSPM